jgi:phosphopantothenate synthetase
VLAPYERLVTRGTDDLDRIAGALDIEVTPEMQDSLRSPSSSVTDQLHRDAEKQLSKWRRKLSEEQVDRILQIVEQVGLSRFYTDALEPNYDRLNRCQSENHRW